MDPDKILQACIGRSSISRVKILAPWAKGEQNGGENEVFNGYKKQWIRISL